MCINLLPIWRSFKGWFGRYQILLLDLEDSTKDIKLFINSPGVSVTAGIQSLLSRLIEDLEFPQVYWLPTQKLSELLKVVIIYDMSICIVIVQLEMAAVGSFN